MKNNQKVGAVIVAAGRGERIGGVDKIFAQIAGEPILDRVVSVFEQCNAIDRIVIVLSEPNLVRGKQLVVQAGFLKVIDVCSGGKLRQESVAAGLSQLKECH